MRALQTTTLFACVLSLSDVVLGDLPLPSSNPVGKVTPSPPSPPGGKKGTDTTSAKSASSTITITASSISTIPLSTTTVTDSGLSTTINTIDISSFVTTSSSSSSLPSSSALSTSTVTASVISNHTGTKSPMSSTSTVSESTNSHSTSHQTLVIILSTVLGFVGLLLTAGAIFLYRRFSRGQAPFGHRGASPINDDEIESWRRSDREKEPRTPPNRELINPVTSLPTYSPAWTWAASPTSIRTISANESEFHSVVAKAPNARAGLTDETIPGADPFITPPKRQSSRLSKAPPGHARSKSRRSSMSTKSIWSGRERSSSDLKGKDQQSAWYDLEDDVTSSHIKTDNGSSSPGISDFFDGVPSGGLSPRPKSRPRLYEISRDDIGRAIA